MDVVSAGWTIPSANGEFEEEGTYTRWILKTFLEFVI